MISSSLTSVASYSVDLTEEIYYKMQTSEPKKQLMEACESCKSVGQSVKTILNKIVEEMAKIEEDIVIAAGNGESGNSHNNPLMIDLVLRNVLGFLKPRDLRRARLVCRLWNGEASTLLRQTEKISFDSRDISKMIRFTEFVQMEEKVGPSFLTYSLSFTTPMPSQVVSNWVGSCGQFVKELELFYPSQGTQGKRKKLGGKEFLEFFIKGLPLLRKVHFINLPHKLTKTGFLQGEDPTSTPLPFLVQLRIDRTWQKEEYEGGENPPWSREFLHDLFQVIPNLQDFELWTWNSTGEEQLSEVYFNELGNSPSSKNNCLEVLRPGSIGDHLSHRLSRLPFHLKKLYLPVLHRNICPQSLEEFLANQKSTLVELQLNCSTLRDRFIHFPSPMEKLQSLHLIVTHPFTNFLESKSLDFSKTFPILKVFRVELGMYQDSTLINHLFPKGDVSLPSFALEELDLTFTGFRDDHFMPTISRMFPSIKKLRMEGYGNRIFMHIFNHLRNLEELEVNLIYGFNVDDQMIGVGKEECMRMRKEMKEQEILTVADPIGGLTNLTKLRTLVIKQKEYIRKMKGEAQAQCISELTLLLSVAKLKDLKSIRIEGIEFSEESKSLLRKELPDAWIKLE